MDTIDEAFGHLAANLDVSFLRKPILRAISLRESVYALFYQFS